MAAAEVFEHEPFGSVLLYRRAVLPQPLQDFLGHDGPALSVLVDEAEDRLAMNDVWPGEENVLKPAKK